MTIEERLKAIGPTEVDPKSQKRTVPKADNMAVLLEQGLASGDKTILNVRIIFRGGLHSFSLLVFISSKVQCLQNVCLISFLS